MATTLNLRDMDELRRKRLEARVRAANAAGPTPSGVDFMGTFAPTTRTWGEAGSRLLPVAGEAWTMDDARRAFNEGNYGEAALNAGLGLLPLGGTIAAVKNVGKKSLASVVKETGGLKPPGGADLVDDPLAAFGSKHIREADLAEKARRQAARPPTNPPRAFRGEAQPDDFWRQQLAQSGDPEAILTRLRAGEHLRPDGTGGFVGGPSHIKGTRGINQYRRELDNQFNEAFNAIKFADPQRAGTWYDRAAGAHMNISEPWMLPQTLPLHGAMSAGVSPGSEFLFSQRHWNSRQLDNPRPGYRGPPSARVDDYVFNGGELPLGPKTRSYVKAQDPYTVYAEPSDAGNLIRKSNEPFATNDFRYAQDMQYLDNQFNPWTAGLSNTQHNFMDAETMMRVDRANRRHLAEGLPAVDGDRYMEVPWVYGKAQDFYAAGSAKPTGRYWGDPVEMKKRAIIDANDTIDDSLSGSTFSMTEGRLPGQSTGHLPEILNASPEAKAAYANEGDWANVQNVAGANTDAVLSSQGFRQLPPVSAPESYMDSSGVLRTDPMKISRPLIDWEVAGKGNVSAVHPETLANLEQNARFKALADAQESYGGHIENTRTQMRAGHNFMPGMSFQNADRLTPNAATMPTPEQIVEVKNILDKVKYEVPVSAEAGGVGPPASIPLSADYMATPSANGLTIMPYDAGSINPNAVAALQNTKQARGPVVAEEVAGIFPSRAGKAKVQSFYGPGIGKWGEAGIEPTAPFSGEATAGFLEHAASNPQQWASNLSESEAVRRSLLEKVARDAKVYEQNPSQPFRQDIQNTRQFLADADWAKAVQMIRSGMKPAAAVAALGYSLASMADEDRRRLEGVR